MNLAAILASTDSGVIGNEGGMPWRLSTDLRRFKRLTMGFPIIMGRKTFDSIGRPLPGRLNVVLTRSADWAHEGVRTVNLEEALAIADQHEQAFVVGGAEIYRLMLPYCQAVHWTRVLADIEGDTRFLWDRSEFELLHDEAFPAGEKDSVPTRYEIWQRQ
ncbi:Dihydrofolate reductase type 3 [Roseimaritima multifibrata]|uniref:Dihydrofolate reductase n=1 Tax=Roseimaritima multifibrata TaxID=1930274 RepID=A0A517MJ68_9BACT|nr:dihydrofolate reductase [Roseimaritima multifibrata]QDS94923.1 Dihydrofolate reductase type 3 [Roseimaritima multifibrata]